MKLILMSIVVSMALLTTVMVKPSTLLDQVPMNYWQSLYKLRKINKPLHPLHPAEPPPHQPLVLSAMTLFQIRPLSSSLMNAFTKHIDPVPPHLFARASPTPCTSPVLLPTVPRN